MSFKKCLLGLAIASMGCISIAGNATPLTTVNNTSVDSTSIIHNPLGINKCSSDLLGEGGITRAGKKNTVSETSLRLACALTPNECVADVYASANCTGELIATVKFSLKNGVYSSEQKSNKYILTASGFNVVLDEVK